MRRSHIAAIVLLGIVGAGAYYYYHMTCCAPPLELPRADQVK
jgi:hypothetical protein